MSHYSNQVINLLTVFLVCMSSLHPCQSISMSCVHEEWDHSVVLLSMKLRSWLTGMNNYNSYCSLFSSLSSSSTCVSLRLYLDSRQCVGGDGEGTGVGGGGELAWCPRLKARWDWGAVIHWDREKASNWTILGQHSPWSFLGGARQSTLLEWRGDSSNDGETILATTRYVNSWN